MTIQKICEAFNVEGTYVNCEPVSTGIINNTYYVRFMNGISENNYIIQKINKNVFTKPAEIMSNIVNVTEFISNNLKNTDLPIDKFVLQVYRTKEGDMPYFIDENGDYWRCYLFIENSMTVDSSSDLKVIERVGQAFGRFQNLLDGFDTKSLFIPIENFHNTPKRYETFKKAIKEDKCGRAKEVKVEIDKLLSFEKKASEIQELLDAGKIPLRVTHNDTKCNNVCFDKDTLESLAVLDLDTVMPGAMAFDFGDGARSIASSSREDEADVQSVMLDLDKYEAFAKGFLGEVKSKLTDLERETLNEGVLTLTVELSVRFLTDYLEGDTYFKTNYPGHNLDRAKNQLALAEDIFVKLSEMNKIMDKYLRR